MDEKQHRSLLCMHCSSVAILYMKIEICLSANIGVQIKPVFQSKKIGQILAPN